jgi:hypothetical protein
VYVTLFHGLERNSKCDVEVDDQAEGNESGGFQGTPKAMLPYSSLFLFGPTNP